MININNIIFLYTIVATVCKIFDYFGVGAINWLWIIGPFWIVTLGPWLYKAVFRIFFSGRR